MNILTKSSFWNYWIYSRLYCNTPCGSIIAFYFYFYFSDILCLIGLMLLILPGGILANFLAFFPLLVSYKGWYSTKLLSRFWLFFLFSAGVLSFSSNNLDSRISSFFGTSDYYYLLLARLVMIANYFSILFIFTISISMRFFFWPIFYNLMPLFKGMADIGAFLSLIRGNFIV